MENLDKTEVISMMDMGKRLEIARIEQEMSQLELAHEVGLSQGMIGKYERGRNRIPPDVLQKISKVLEKPISYFYGEESLSGNSIRDILREFVKDGGVKYSARISGTPIPMLDEILATDIIDQIALAKNRYFVSPNLVDEKDNCFAIRTSNLGTIDLDVAVDTTIVVSPTITPINGDKVLLIHDNECLVRSFYKVANVIEYRTSNPMFSEPIPKSDEYKQIGVIIAVEKRL